MDQTFLLLQSDLDNPSLPVIITRPPSDQLWATRWPVAA